MMIERLHEYEWSSYSNYTRMKNVFTFIDPEQILYELDRDPRKSRRKYYRTIYGREEYGKSILSEIKHGFILGCDSFSSGIMNIVKKKGSEMDIPQLKKLRNEETLDLVFTEILKMSGQTSRELTENPGRKRNPARLATCISLPGIPP